RSAAWTGHQFSKTGPIAKRWDAKRFWGGAPAPEAMGRGLCKDPEKEGAFGQREALAKASRALAPSGARDAEAPLGPLIFERHLTGHGPRRLLVPARVLIAGDAVAHLEDGEHPAHLDVPVGPLAG